MTKFCSQSLKFCPQSLENVVDKKASKSAIKKGRAEGKEEGEKQTKIAVAKNSLKAGISIDVIAEITGLSLNEIEKLRD